jgi:hypothetical protein
MILGHVPLGAGSGWLGELGCGSVALVGPLGIHQGNCLGVGIVAMDPTGIAIVGEESKKAILIIGKVVER